MIPTSFPEENKVLDKPPSMKDCDPLNVHVSIDPPMVVSCWKLTREELEEINKTGKVWLMIWGQGMPPVNLQVRTPFK